MNEKVEQNKLLRYCVLTDRDRQPPLLHIRMMAAELLELRRELADGIAKKL